MTSPLLKTAEKSMVDSGITVSELARMTGVPLRTLQRWFSGDHPAALDDFLKIMKALNLKIEELNERLLK